MKDQRIFLGIDGDGHKVTIDIPTLVATRMLVTARSEQAKICFERN